MLDKAFLPKEYGRHAKHQARAAKNMNGPTLHCLILRCAIRIHVYNALYSRCSCIQGPGSPAGCPRVAQPRGLALSSFGQRSIMPS